MHSGVGVSAKESYAGSILQNKSHLSDDLVLGAPLGAPPFWVRVISGGWQIAAVWTAIQARLANGKDRGELHDSSAGFQD